MGRKRTQQVQAALLEQVFWRSKSPVRTVARQFGLTRQAVQQHVRRLVETKQLAGSGAGRWRRYELVRRDYHQQEFDLRTAITEDTVWSEVIRPRINALDAAEQNLLHYGITEMVNNAIDHSGAATLTVDFWRTANSVSMRVADDGIGIFRKIANTLKLSDPRQGLLELGKGKFTTDPERHTGEGVFFTSRSFDRFLLRSSELLFSRSAASEDWLVDVEDKTYRGTRVTMSLLLPARRRLEEVFKKHSSGPEDYRFAKTHLPLKLATFGDETLISRSSARRVLARVERFDEVLLDFKTVRTIGPAFADEIFRVFAREHPHVQLIPINANEQVTGMIRRAESAKSEDSGGLFDQRGS